MKRNQGITLIALIVTIIVLIILAGISVNLLLGQNGLIQRAKDAAAQQERAELVEGMKLAIANKQILTKGVLTQADIEEVLGEYGTVADGKVTTTKGGYEIAITDVYSGTVATPPAPTLSAVETLLGYTGNTNSNDLVVGDHINYYYANGTAPIECVVLYKDSTHGIQVISVNTVGSDIRLGAKDGSEDPKIPSSMSSESDFEKAKYSYNHAVENLNSYAMAYVPEGGMATDGRCVGSNPLIGQKNSSESNAMMTASNDPIGYEREWMTSNGWYNSFKLGDEYYSEDYNTMKNMTTPIHNLGKNYWLASRDVYASSSNSDFSVRCVNSSGSTINSYLCNVYRYGSTGRNACEYAFRPVFLLKSDIPVEKIS